MDYLNIVLCFFVTSQLSELRINDSGTYQCLVQTDEGADYKEIALSVTGKEQVTAVVALKTLFWEWACSLARVHGHFWAISFITKVKLRQILLNLVKKEKKKKLFAFLEIYP